MIHIIRSDFYKLKKARYFWICLMASILLAVVTIFILDFTYKVAGEQMEASMASQEQALQENGFNISTEGIPVSYDELTASSQMVSFFAGNTPLILAILISLFVGSEFNNGTIKNMVSKNYSRTKIYASKLITSCAAAIFFTLVSAAASAVTATALWGFGETPDGYWPELFASAGLELLLLCAFVSIFVMFAILIRQNGGSLAASIGFLEFFYLFVVLGEALINKIFDQDLALSNYLIDANMSAIAAGLDHTVVTRSLWVGLGFFAVAALIGLISFQKRDIK